MKAPEIDAFEIYLPKDVRIITCHSLHGPKVNPKGLPLVIIPHRCDDESLGLMVHVLTSLKSEIVFLDYKMHDSITADTQAVTHVAFLSMGTAW